MSKTQVAISLGSDEDELEQLFSYDSDESDSGLQLTDVIGHWFNQTLIRANFYGAWAEAWYPSPKSGVTDFGIKLTSPTDDVSAYGGIIPKFLAAGRAGLELWNSIENPPEGLFFQLPLGLSMANTRAIQLLHYPPITVRQYMNYLYSPTNRRCESLLCFHHYPGPDLRLVETITDLVPIAADGGNAGAKQVDSYNATFVVYDRKMLAARLRDPSMPVVAYGSPVRNWIETNFDFKHVEVNQLVRLPLVDGGPPVAVLSTNHPTEYLYYTDGSDPKAAETLLTQDLVATGWQAETSLDWTKNKDDVLADQKTYWDSAEGQARVKVIRQSQDAEFGYAHPNV